MSLQFSDKAEDCGAVREALDGGGGRHFYFGGGVVDSEAGTSGDLLYLC